MKKTIFALLLALAAAPVLAANNVGQIDVNGDGDITEEELDSSFQGSAIYDVWDVDGDNVINESEFSTGVFGIYDADSDGDITEEEWDSTYDGMLGWYVWDADDSGYIDEAEFFDAYFDYYDVDNDGAWDEHEWEEAGLFDI